MFSSSLEQVQRYTLPVIISKQYFNGEVECGCGTFIIFNEEGWILTVEHLFDNQHIYDHDQAEIIEYDRKVQEIESDIKLDVKKKNKKIQKLQRNPKWIKKISYFWGDEGFTIKNFIIDKARDLAIGKIECFDKSYISTYPVFKNPSDAMFTGTSLCKLGFPFHDITATFNDEKDSFELADGTLPMTFFPMDGIFTRLINVKDSVSGNVTKYLETSTPGLRGQSGGPIFDICGNIWALQSYTSHLSLGFNPSINKGNKNIEEFQFLNVGCGTHVEEIISFLRENNVEVEISGRT